MQLQNNHYFVYILNGQSRNELEIGTADNLEKRVKDTNATLETNQLIQDYKLVYYEHYNVQEMALARERQIKDGAIDNTYQLIESMNPNWLDLSDLLEE
ncbi:GIY-YIG nuclease family protein [Pontibacter harenae]|uniref:GIY-YIG nuclease family protein n=1 Tax=Pontibacter harenae TaxID=2894083 RepID=UPI001E606244|nr:GIY-YIG nuclease family protein [Pontibacter harenae]MCC9167089.1 GIY-YIG nuclease family protein [Pontibacter harenae]